MISKENASYGVKISWKNEQMTLVTYLEYSNDSENIHSKALAIWNTNDTRKDLELDIRAHQCTQ